MIFHSPLNCTKRRFLPRKSGGSGRLFLQIGAGAGNLDARTLDGFTEFVKRQHLEERDAVVLVEPNPANVSLLRDYWRSHCYVSVIPVAILPSGASTQELTVWFALEDAPNFQCASYSREHVEAHFPRGTIQSMDVPTMSFDELMRSIDGAYSLELLAVDVESLDADLIMSVDWRTYPFRAISFEAFHLRAEENAIHERFVQSGYLPAGVGVDTNGLDALVIRTESVLLKMRARMWELERLANLRFVSGNPWKSFLYVLNYWRTNQRAQHG